VCLTGWYSQMKVKCEWFIEVGHIRAFVLSMIIRNLLAVIGVIISTVQSILWVIIEAARSFRSNHIRTAMHFLSFNVLLLLSVYSRTKPSH